MKKETMMAEKYKAMDRTLLYKNGQRQCQLSKPDERKSYITCIHQKKKYAILFYPSG